MRVTSLGVALLMAACLDPRAADAQESPADADAGLVPVLATPATLPVRASLPRRDPSRTLLPTTQIDLASLWYRSAPSAVPVDLDSLENDVRALPWKLHVDLPAGADRGLGVARGLGPNARAGLDWRVIRSDSINEVNELPLHVFGLYFRLDLR